jgi:hypothetical protein
VKPLVAGLLLLSFGPAFADSPALPPIPDAERGTLEAQAGTWDATVEAFLAPGPPTTSSAVETNHLACDGRWLVTEFKGSFMGQPFEGHGVLGWDTFRKKLVGSWVDSAAAGLQTIEGAFDPEARILTLLAEGPDLSGKVVTSREITEWKSPDVRVLTIFNPGTLGKESIALRITYKRRK